jgi:hypothetical protein
MGSGLHTHTHTHTHTRLQGNPCVHQAHSGGPFLGRLICSALPARGCETPCPRSESLLAHATLPQPRLPMLVWVCMQRQKFQLYPGSHHPALPGQESGGHVFCRGTSGSVLDNQKDPHSESLRWVAWRDQGLQVIPDLLGG